MEALRKEFPLSVLKEMDTGAGDEETSQMNQTSVLIKRGFLKAKRDSVSRKEEKIDKRITPN